MTPRSSDSSVPADIPFELPLEEPAVAGPAAPVIRLENESAAVPDPSLAGPQARRWAVGTLTYTSGGLAALFGVLLCGDFAYSMRERSVSPIVQLMLRRLHASDTVMALLFSTLPTILALGISPIVSVRSDNYRSRWGRRIPFLLIPTPIAAGAMIGIAYVDDLGIHLQRIFGLGPSHTDACALACFGVFWTMFEVAAIVAGAVLGGLVNDIVPRQLHGRFYGMFRQVSLGAGVIFNFLIIGQAEAHFRIILIGIALLFFVGFSAMCLMVKEGEYPPPADPRSAGRSNPWEASRRYFRQGFKLPYYRWVFVGLALAGASFTPVNLYQVLYAKQINVSIANFGHLLALSYFISFFLASPLGWIVDKAHTLRVSMATIFIYSSLMIGLGFTVHNARTFGVALVLHTVLSGCYFTVSSPLGQALFPRMSFAQYASAGGIVSSLFTILFAPALGRLLDATGHDYRLTYFVGGMLGLTSVAALLVVHRDFMRLGGTRAYIAPEVAR